MLTNDEPSDESLLFSVYPNPSEGQFIIEPKFHQDYTLKVFNSKGQLELESKNQNGISQFRINHGGLYFLQVNDGQSLQVSKIIVH